MATGTLITSALLRPVLRVKKMQQKMTSSIFQQFEFELHTRPQLTCPIYNMADKKDTKPVETKPEENKDNKDEKKDQTIRALDEGDIHILRTYVCTQYFGNFIMA